MHPWALTVKPLSQFTSSPAGLSAIDFPRWPREPLTGAGQIEATLLTSLVRPGIGGAWVGKTVGRRRVALFGRRVGMFEAENIRDWRGHDVVDADGHKIGDLEAITWTPAPTCRPSARSGSG